MKQLDNWPGLSEDMKNVVRIVRAGEMPDDSNFHVRRHEFYHVKDVASLANPITFFNSGPAGVECNWPSASGLPNEYAFVLDQVAVNISIGYKADGTAQANGVNVASAAGGAAMKIAEDLHQIYERGQLDVRMADRSVAFFASLYACPPGQGPNAAINYTDSTATTVTSVQFLTNGQPNGLSANMLIPQVLLPNKQISAVARWANSGRTLTATAGFAMHVWLRGVLITPSNL